MKKNLTITNYKDRTNVDVVNIEEEVNNVEDPQLNLNSGKVKIRRLNSLDNIDSIKQMKKELQASTANNTNNSIPSWISCSNFMCLLNLPNSMRQFGPLINLLEGRYQGEGYLHIATKHFKTDIQGN